MNMYIIEEEKDKYGIDPVYVIYNFDMETGKKRYITFFKNYEAAKEHVSELTHIRNSQKINKKEKKEMGEMNFKNPQVWFELGKNQVVKGEIQQIESTMDATDYVGLRDTDGRTRYCPSSLNHSISFTGTGTLLQNEFEELKNEIAKQKQKLDSKTINIKIDTPLRTIKVSPEYFMDLKSIEKNGDTLTFLWEHGEPTVLTKAKGDKEDLATAFVYAFFMHAMGWTKAKAHKFLDSLETSQDKRKRLNEEKAKKAQEEKAQKEKEYKKKIKRVAKKQLRKRKFWDDVEKEVNKIEKK